VLLAPAPSLPALLLLLRLVVRVLLLLLLLLPVLLIQWQWQLSAVITARLQHLPPPPWPTRPPLLLPLLLCRRALAAMGYSCITHTPQLQQLPPSTWLLLLLLPPLLPEVQELPGNGFPARVCCSCCRRCCCCCCCVLFGHKRDIRYGFLRIKIEVMGFWGGPLCC
jgi:hypothetical protein